jgi:hypothetical protein
MFTEQCPVFPERRPMFPAPETHDPPHQGEHTEGRAA